MEFCRKLFASSLVLLLWLALSSSLDVVAQTSATSPSAAPANPTQPNASSDSASKKPAAAAPDKDYHISPEETKQLFEEVDRIFTFVSEDTGLPMKGPIQKRIVTRQEVANYVETQLNKDESAKRLERSQLVLKKFGLIPREFDLHKAFVKLLQDQVAAYYDPKTKTVNLLDWVPLDQQESVVAHELTHAIQDQNFNLLKYEKEASPDPPASQLDVTEAEVAADERGGAREAVVEGQAMVVMMDYFLRDEGTSVADSPSLVDAMKHSMETSDQSIAMAETPLFLKDSLTFPYFYGLDFARYLLQHERDGGKDAAKGDAQHIAMTKQQKERAFREPYRTPPETSHDVMNPEAFARGERIVPMALARFSPILHGKFERYDAGAIGEFDAHLLAKQYADAATADRVAAGWRGGYYFAVRPLAQLGESPVAPPVAKDRLNLIFASQWKDEAAARDFADVYARGLGQRYTNAQPDKTVPQDSPIRRWTTEEGIATLEVQGTFVFALEGFDEATANELRAALHHAAGLSAVSSAASVSAGH